MKGRKSPRARRESTVATFILVLFGVMVAIILVRAARRPGDAAVNTGGRQAGRSTGGLDSVAIVPVAPDLPPLPLPRGPLPRSASAVQAAYEFAARHPEVLERLPCFCGCERLGHSSNRHCFVASRQADGRVTWDAHGMG